MTLAKFREDPWQTSHKAYQGTAWAVLPAPEYASPEVMLSSLYRVIGLATVKESDVPQEGRNLDREIQRRMSRQLAIEGAALEPETLFTMLHSALESPKLPNQSSKRFLQVTPVVPQSAIFSGAPRLAGSPWSPGTLVRRIVWLGSATEQAAHATWRALFDALSVGDVDDVFARFLQAEIAAWVPTPAWTYAGPIEGPSLDPEDAHGCRYPAAEFVRDLESIIAAKSLVTRRQWTSLLEAVLRIGAVAHVMWLCEVQANAWVAVRQALQGKVPGSVDETRRQLFPQSFSYLSYGDRALSGIKDRASRYLQARLGLNATLWALEEEDPARMLPDRAFASARDFHAMLLQVVGSDVGDHVLAVVEEVGERESRAVLCSKGIGSNLMEFARHVLGQRQTANPVLRGYDQGFVLRKRGPHHSSPWVVGMGPVAVLALVHCSLAGSGGPRSVRRLAQHLAAYGIAVDPMDIAQNDLGHQLRILGLVLDSPDAESGMLLVPPFGSRVP